MPAAGPDVAEPVREATTTFTPWSSTVARWHAGRLRQQASSNDILMRAHPAGDWLPLYSRAVKKSVMVPVLQTFRYQPWRSIRRTTSHHTPTNASANASDDTQGPNRGVIHPAKPTW